MPNFSDRLVDSLLTNFLASDLPMYFVLLLAFMVTTLGLSALAKAKRRRSKLAKKQGKAAPAQAAATAPAKADMRDTAQQMNAIKQANFAVKPLFNKEELRVLPILDGIVADLGQGHRLLLQTSMGELLTTKGKSAQIKDNGHRSINSKRLDFAIVDRAGLLKLAIEYQGSGHYQNDAFMRDAVKREALRKAGVHMLELRKNHTAEQITAEVMVHFASESGAIPRQDSDMRPGPSQRPDPRGDSGPGHSSATISPRKPNHKAAFQPIAPQAKPRRLGLQSSDG